MTRRGVIVGYAVGEAGELPLRPTFDRRIKLEFHGATLGMSTESNERRQPDR
jgi:hypothetical protein